MLSLPLTRNVCSRGASHLQNVFAPSVARTYLETAATHGCGDETFVASTALEVSRGLEEPNSAVFLGGTALSQLSQEQPHSVEAVLAKIGRAGAASVWNGDYNAGAPTRDTLKTQRGFLSAIAGYTGSVGLKNFAETALQLTSSWPAGLLTTIALGSALEVLQKEPESRPKPRQELPEGILLAQWGASLSGCLDGKTADLRNEQNYGLLSEAGTRVMERIANQGFDDVQKAVAQTSVRLAEEQPHGQNRLHGLGLMFAGLADETPLYS